MKTLRTAVACITLLLLVGGYFVSQFSYLQGLEAATAYAQRVDSPPVKAVSLFLLFLVVVLGFLPDKELENEPTDGWVDHP